MIVDRLFEEMLIDVAKELNVDVELASQPTPRGRRVTDKKLWDASRRFKLTMFYIGNFQLNMSATEVAYRLGGYREYFNRNRIPQSCVDLGKRVAERYFPDGERYEKIAV